MLVTMQKRGRGITELHIGASNVRRHFSRDMRTVELDHLRIECDLKPDFWRDQPEISDPRLCSWLKAKNVGGGGAGQVVMFPAGERLFRLRLTRPEADDDESPLPPAPAA
jgi:hypothetical protein